MKLDKKPLQPHPRNPPTPSLQSFANSMASSIPKGSFATTDIFHSKNAHFLLSLKKQPTTQSQKSLQGFAQAKKGRKIIKAEEVIKVDNLEPGSARKAQGSIVRSNEQGQIQDLHRDTYQTKVRVNADQFMSTVSTAIDHFSANYGETLSMKTAVEYAPKFDYNLLEQESKELHKVYDPLKRKLKKQKKNLRLAQLKFDKLMANVNYTKQVRFAL